MELIEFAKEIDDMIESNRKIKQLEIIYNLVWHQAALGAAIAGADPNAAGYAALRRFELGVALETIKEKKGHKEND